MSSRKVSSVHRFSKGFTLIELLLAMTVLAVILMTLAMMMNQTTGAWRQARSQLEQFREAEAAFGSMGRRITDAVLNTYTDYEFPGGDRRKTPTRYVRQSELHFVCGPGGQVEGGLAPSLLGAQAAPGQAVFFQGPFGSHSDGDLTGLNTLLNAWGYFVEFGDDREARPGYLEEAVGAQPRHRFRLKEFQQKTEELRVYASNLTAASQDVLFDWFREPVSSGRGVHTLAENVIALVIRPMSSDKTLAAPTQMASHYYYDTRAYQQNVGTAFEQARSRHQLPPLLEITLVVLDENSAARLEQENGSAMPDLGLSQLFHDAASYEKDLDELEATLVARKLGYRALKKTIRLRNSRWSAVD
jgi:uncharacterized protein (TIGR02599 family)